MDKAQFLLSKPSAAIPRAESERCKEGERVPLNNGAYRAITDRIALQQLIVPVFIPNPNLEIDTADNFQPYSLSYYRKSPKTRQAVVLPDPQVIPIEMIAPNFQGNPVQFTDFPSDFYVGNPLGGF